jgi:hypothetical protein
LDQSPDRRNERAEEENRSQALDLSTHGPTVVGSRGKCMDFNSFKCTGERTYEVPKREEEIWTVGSWRVMDRRSDVSGFWEIRNREKGGEIFPNFMKHEVLKRKRRSGPLDHGGSWTIDLT